jgi:hypothetical protein
MKHELTQSSTAAMAASKAGEPIEFFFLLLMLNPNRTQRVQGHHVFWLHTNVHIVLHREEAHVPAHFVQKVDSIYHLGLGCVCMAWEDGQ